MTAPTKATGGAGYTFADKVAAGFLAQMLKRKFALENDLGVTTEVHFETRDVGHVLDDLRLTLCAVSVKSNRQLTKSGFNNEFVQDAWEEWRSAPSFLAHASGALRATGSGSTASQE